LQQDKHKKELQAFKPNADNIGQVKELFEMLGVPMIQAPHEADALVAQLWRNGLVTGVVTIDTDQFAYGADNVLLVEGSVNDLDAYKINDVYASIGLTPSEFLDFCIMCGCDYLKNIPKLGIKTALKLIKEHHNIETILQNLPVDSYVVPENYLDSFNIARGLFLNNPDGTVPDTVTAESLIWRMDQEKAKTWLSEKYPTVYNQFHKTLFPGKSVQGSISQFFLKPISTPDVPVQETSVTNNNPANPTDTIEPTEPVKERSPKVFNKRFKII